MQVNIPVLLASLGVTMVVGIGFGLIPALAATRGGASHDIRLASRRTVGATGRMRSALVVAEMALAVIVLVSSGLLLRSMRKLLDVSPGFDARGVVALRLVPVGQRFNTTTTLWQYYEQIAVAARQIPGVQVASFTSQLPLSDDFDQSGIHSQRHPRPNPSDDPSAHRYGVTPGYLEAMRIPIVRGRSILPADDGAARDSIALVNEQFAAKHFFPGEDPIGQRIRIGDPRNGAWRMIVGVTGDIRQVSLAGGVADAVYVPERQQAFADGPIWLVVRTTRSLPEVAAQVRSVVRRVDPTQPIVRLASMERIIASSASGRRFVLTLFEVFAALSALLGGLGMYGVLSASVTERIREIGVREALGATAMDITRMIVGRAVGLAAIGAVIGMVATRFTTALISDQLFETTPTDTATLVGVLVGLGAIAVAASLLPAARAARVDPMESLRAE
jgi:predicted permease